jgi:hypothetical protein
MLFVSRALTGGNQINTFTPEAASSPNPQPYNGRGQTRIEDFLLLCLFTLQSLLIKGTDGQTRSESGLWRDYHVKLFIPASR